MRNIPAISVRQPWAWALIHGPKRIENRTWVTGYRGPLLIHAALDDADLEWSERFAEIPDLIDFGAIIGIVDLVDCVHLAGAPADEFATGPYCWITANPRPIEPAFECKGGFKLWQPPDAFFEIHFAQTPLELAGTTPR